MRNVYSDPRGRDYVYFSDFSLFLNGKMILKLGKEINKKIRDRPMISLYVITIITNCNPTNLRMSFEKLLFRILACLIY